MITLEGVSKIYHPDAVALQDVSLTIEPGEFVFLVGQSGAGKSTLVRLLTGEERPTSGSITVNDWTISDIRQRDLPKLRRAIGVVYQDFKLLEQKTVEENVAFALEVCGEHRRVIKEAVPQILSIVGLDEMAHRYPRQLSGGEQQRVAIARAMVHQPSILIADEPTGDLDTVTARTIVDVLLKIHGLGTTVIFVTHNRDVVNMLKKRVITLHDGALTADRRSGKYFI